MSISSDYNQIPSLNLSDFLSDDENLKLEFVKKLGEGFEKVGFIALKNHFLSPKLEKDLYTVVKAFFSLKDSLKQKYELPELNGQRGYVGKYKEHAKDSSLADLKEFYHVGQPGNCNLNYPSNIDVIEQPDFLLKCEEAFRQLEKTGQILLKAIALYLGLEESYFEEKVKCGNSILRPIHYFPITNDKFAKAGAVRAGAHGDINLITLLMGASAEGLEILRADGKWIGVTALEEHLVINVGDMLQRLTNGKLKSTIHRVVNPSVTKLNEPRYSIPFFMHPKSDVSLACLAQCISKEHPKRFDDITAGVYLDQRLMEIGLKK